MKRFLIPAALVSLGACQPGVEAPAAVEVTDVFCRPTQAGRDVTGCYMVLTASRDDRLISVTSPAADDVQIHETSMEGGMMRMAEMPAGLPLPAGEAVRLAPGGDHVMALGVSEPLAEGDHLSLALTFEHAPAYEVNARVAEPGVPSEDHSGH